VRALQGGWLCGARFPIECSLVHICRVAVNTVM
jgi:hypothetical protein